MILALQNSSLKLRCSEEVASSIESRKEVGPIFFLLVNSDRSSLRYNLPLQASFHSALSPIATTTTQDDNTATESSFHKVIANQQFCTTNAPCIVELILNRLDNISHGLALLGSSIRTSVDNIQACALSLCLRTYFALFVCCMSYKDDVIAI